MNETENNEKNIRHEAIQELLGNPPGWLVRWGISVFFTILLLLIIGSHFFRYPEVLKASITITTEKPSTWIVTETSGYIDSVYVKNHDKVKKGNLIATIQNTAHIEDIKKLSSILDSIQMFTMLFNNENIYIPQENLQIGELQRDYAQLIKLLQDFASFQQNNINKIRICAMQEELYEQKRLIEQTKKQIDLYTQYHIIKEKQFQRDSLLYSTHGAIAATEKENTEMRYLDGKIQLEQTRYNMIQSKISMLKLNQSINEYTADLQIQYENYRTNIQVAFEQLRSQLWNWEKKYLLKAPADGIISFSTYWGENQPIQAGDKSFAIVPQNPGKIIGKCQVPINGTGKIQRGQRVIIKLKEYPYMEFGMLEGTVENVYLVPVEEQNSNIKERFGTIDVSFPEKLITTYHKEINFPGELSGDAEISTNEISLLEHFLYPIKHLLNR